MSRKHSQADNHESDDKSRSPKTEREKIAEDLVYTLNHAIVCGTTDIIDPFIGNWTQQYLGKRISISGHGHDDHHHDHHGHDHHAHDHHAHDHHAHDHDNPSLGGNLKHWIIGEAVGDVGAVPLTVGMQVFAPEVMRGIQYVAEPLMGPVFRWSARDYAQKWGHKRGYAPDSEEVRAREEKVYQHEVQHLPHAAMWTVSAAGLNVLTQKLIGNTGQVMHLAAGKAGGALMTLGLVLGFRSLMPHRAQELDEFNTKHIAEPVTRWVSRRLGIDSDTVERVLSEQRELELPDEASENNEKIVNEPLPDATVQAKGLRASGRVASASALTPDLST